MPGNRFAGNGAPTDPRSAREAGPRAFAGVDQLIRMFNEYDPDARFDSDSDLRATTLRGALENVRETLKECDPNEVDRVSEALTSK
jgi:hypothetical protein